MKINRFRYFFPLIIVFLFHSSSGAVVYEASTLHNGVSRSDTVQGLFYKRWDNIVEDSLYLDLYCRINWLQGFQVKAYNRGTGYSVNGWIFKIEYNMPLGGFHFMVNKNYSEEIRKLVEAADKLAIEGSLFFRI